MKKYKKIKEIYNYREIQEKILEKHDVKISFSSLHYFFTERYKSYRIAYFLEKTFYEE